MATTKERRLHARQLVIRPCAVFRRNTQKYVSARTCDVSAGGVLLEVQTPRPIGVGERLDVGVAWSNSPIMLEDALMEAKVIRVITVAENRQQIALQFQEVGEIAAVA